MKPPDVPFAEALKEAEALLSKLQDKKGPPGSLAKQLEALLATTSGARGFLVSYLTSDSPFADEPPSFLIEAFETSAPIVCDLLAKNLVMSSTMALTHERNDDRESAVGSLKVQERTARLIRLFKVGPMDEAIKQMWTSVTTGSGTYAQFLQRWHYDQEQLERAQSALLTVMTADSN